MKKIISVLTAAALLAPLAAVRAKEEMTADKVIELLCVHSIANSPERDRIMSYEYFDYYSDEINTEKTLGELCDPSRSFREFHIAGPDEFNTYYDYKDGDILSVFEETGSSDYTVYCIETRGSEYINLTVLDGSGYYTPDILTTIDPGKVASAINNAGLAGVSDIRFCRDFYYVKAAEGEFAVTAYEHSNIRRKNAVLAEWTVFPLGEYLKFVTDIAMDEYNGAQKLADTLAAAELPDEFKYTGDTPRDTTYFADYNFSQSPFTDTSGITAKAAALLFELGVTNGCGDGKYMPELDITMAQAGIMLERLMKNGASYTEGYNGADTLNAVSAADLLFRLTGDSHIPASPDRIYTYGLWMLNGIENFDANGSITRGQFAVMLCNALDRQLTVAAADPGLGFGVNTTVYLKDITLIDYINGKKPNGAYLPSPSAAEAWQTRYFTWLYTTYGNAFYEYYGDEQWITSEMEKYGWTKPE